MSERNAIPDFSEDVASMAAAMRVMKQLLEELTGQRPGQGAGAPRVYYEVKAPQKGGGKQLRRGDFWIQEGTRVMYVWDGDLWRQLQTP